MSRQGNTRQPRCTWPRAERRQPTHEARFFNFRSKIHVDTKTHTLHRNCETSRYAGARRKSPKRRIPWGTRVHLTLVEHAASGRVEIHKHEQTPPPLGWSPHDADWLSQITAWVLTLTCEFLAVTMSLLQRRQQHPQLDRQSGYPREEIDAFWRQKKPVKSKIWQVLWNNCHPQKI